MLDTKQEMTIEDREFMRRRAAYEHIACEHQGALLSHALRLCSRVHAVAEEYVQDALVRGYEAFLDGKFREGTNARAWLLKILTNSFLSERRRDRFHSSESVEELQTAVNTPAALQTTQREDPEWLALSTTFSEPIELALDALPDELRLAVLLTDVEELSYAEVASICKIPVGTVRSRLFRARRELARWLTANSQSHDDLEAYQGDR